MNETQLLDGLRAGEDAARERLVRAYAGRMLAAAKRIVRNEQDAQDCVQEAFLRAFRKMDSFEGRSSVGTWLHRILLNCALERRRHKEGLREDPLDHLLPQFDQSGLRLELSYPRLPSVEEMLETRRIRDLVRRRIDDLPESYRIVLLLRDIEELDTAETADLLGVTVGTVKIRLHRARAALKKLLEPGLLGDVE